MPSIAELIAWLEADEGRSRPYRAQRLQLLVNEYGPESLGLFPGGPIGAMAFEEARLTYLHWIFVACTVMCQICLEHMLAALFRMAGRDDLDRATYKRLLREARDQSFLSEEEFRLFERLRSLRNPY